MYAVITEDGALTFYEERATLAAVDAIVGQYGHDNIRLEPASGLVGWTSDCALVASVTGFKRNPVAACVLATLGAHQQPYAGPIVFTGYEYPKPDEEEWGVPEPLRDDQRAGLRRVHTWVTVALDGATPGPGHDWLQGDPRLWADEVRSLAHEVETSGIPPITFTAAQRPRQGEGEC